MRKVLPLLITLALLLAMSVPALADTNTIVIFTIGSQTYTVNGQAQTMDAAPFIDASSSRTYVPVRFLAQALGASVDWNAQSKTVTLTDGGTTEAMVIGSTGLTVNGQAQTMDTAPHIVPPGRTVLPARWVAEAFGYTVTWDASAQTVTISEPQNGATGVSGGGSGETGSGGSSSGGGTTVVSGPIGTVPFQPVLENLTVTVGRTTATGTDLSGKPVTVSLPAVPVLVVPTNQGKEWYLDHSANNTSDAYTDQDIIVNSAIKTDIYVPVIPVLQAFGVPAANVQWDGSRLTIYLTPSEPVYLMPGSAVDTGADGSTGHLQDPLLLISGVPMLSQSDLSGFMFNEIDTGLLKGVPSTGGADMYHGTVLFNYSDNFSVYHP